MFAIVLICLGLNVAYLAFSAGMLYGAIKVAFFYAKFINVKL
jgi:hypothetical protein